MGWRRAASPALVFALTALVFWPCLKFGFVSYDDALFVRMPVRGLGWDSLSWIFTNSVQGNYAPLSGLTYAVDFAFWGMLPRGYHLTSVLFHAANAAVFFLLSLELLSLGGGAQEENRAAAFVAALLFSLHPLRVQSVAWVAERRDVVCGLFVLLTLLFWVRSRPRAALAAFLCALLSKAAALPLPAVLVLLDYWPLERRLVWKRYAPFVAAAALFSAVALAAQSRIGALVDVAAAPPSMRARQILTGAVYYLGKALWPAGLGIYEWRSWAPVKTATIVGAAATAVLLAAAWLRPKLRRPLLGALAFQTVMLAPVLGFVTFGHELVADRYSYLSGLAWALLAAAGLRALSERRRGTAALLAGVVVAACAAATRAELPAWRGSESFWRAVLRVDPMSWSARPNLAQALSEAGRNPEAFNYLEDQVRVFPGDAEVRDQLATMMSKTGTTARDRARYRAGLGLEAEREGRPELALWHFEQALRLDPTYESARAELEKLKR
jgi:tetratricopeptide (TPR) repeat protein